MFFVAVGVVILLASFLIALISLLREQEERQDAWSQPVPASDPTNEEIGEKQTVNVEASDVDNLQVVPQESGEPDLLVSDSVFPWEVREEKEEAEPEPEVVVPVEPRSLEGEISMQSIRAQRATLRDQNMISGMPGMKADL